jgi:hypothetical protein
MFYGDFDERKYVIISSIDVVNIDFSQVLEESQQTLRFSVDESLTFVKYEGYMPNGVVACSSKSREYSHEEILQILNADDGVWWTDIDT